MPKGYLIAHIRPHDTDRMQEFRDLARAAIEKHGGRVLVNTPVPEVKEGDESGTAVVIEFEDIDTARIFYHSSEYSAARAIREEAAETDLILAEGL